MLSLINGCTQCTLKGKAEKSLIGCRFRGSLCSPLTILQRIKSSTCMISVVFFFQPISGFSALPTLKWIRSIRRDKRMTWTNTLSVTCKWIDGRKHVQMNGCSI